MLKLCLLMPEGAVLESTLSLTQAEPTSSCPACLFLGPNSKVKPTPTCVPLADGSAVIVHRPIAADNSCLFNAVGYCMHHSINRAPFLRQVVSREVSSDPQVCGCGQPHPPPAHMCAVLASLLLAAASAFASC